MGVPRGTRAPLNPVSSACNDCVSQDFIQQKIPFGCCGSVQGTCSTLQGKDWWRAHKDKSRIVSLKKLKLGTRGRTWGIFSKKEKKGHAYVFFQFACQIMTSKVLFIISEMMVMLPVTLMEARLGREVMVLKILSLSELAAEDSLYFKNAPMGKVGLKNILV